MDLLVYRIEQSEKRADALDHRLSAVEASLTDIKVMLASIAGSVATKNTVQGWGIGVVVATVATGLAVAAIGLQGSNNQLAAFQSGLAAVQAVVGANQAASPRHY